MNPFIFMTHLSPRPISKSCKKVVLSLLYGRHYSMEDINLCEWRFLVYVNLTLSPSCPIHYPAGKNIPNHNKSRLRRNHIMEIEIMHTIIKDWILLGLLSLLNALCTSYPHEGVYTHQHWCNVPGRKYIFIEWMLDWIKWE